MGGSGSEVMAQKVQGSMKKYKKRVIWLNRRYSQEDIRYMRGLSESDIDGGNKKENK